MAKVVVCQGGVKAVSLDIFALGHSDREYSNRFDIP